MTLPKSIRLFVSVIFSLWFPASVFAQISLNPVQDNLSIKAGIENRTTNFRWSIAGNTSGTDPNIFSELIYNPIQSAGFYAEVTYQFVNRINIATSFNQLYTYKGAATDIDYAGNNRTNYIPPAMGDTIFTSNVGNITAYDISASYAIINKTSLKIGAGAAYHFSNEKFYLRDTEIEGLNTTYQAKWSAARIFLNGTVAITPQLYIKPELSFLPGSYNASANWNKQEDFKHPVSFIHQANSHGWNLKATLGYQLNKNFGVEADYLYADWKTNHGLDRLYLKNGETPETRMNGAFKKSSSWRLSLNYTF